MKIEIDLPSKESIHHKYNKNTLAPELANFIYDECLGFSKDNNIEINIYTDEFLSNEEQLKIDKLIRDYFIQEIMEYKIKNKYVFMYSTLIIMIGIIFLISSFIITESFIKEVFSIIGWVALWEIIYNIFFVEKKKIFALAVIKKLVTRISTFLRKNNFNKNHNLIHDH